VKRSKTWQKFRAYMPQNILGVT